MELYIGFYEAGLRQGLYKKFLGNFGENEMLENVDFLGVLFLCTGFVTQNDLCL